MATPNIQDILNQIETGIAGIAESTLKNYITEAKTDGKDIITTMEEDIARWSNELASGQLSESDFKDLVAGQQDVLKMTALKQAGITAIQIDQFKKAVINLVINTVITAVKALLM